jgi:geranylgeranyl diphosphate synthase type I
MTTTIEQVGHDTPGILLAEARQRCAPVIRSGIEGLSEPLRGMAGDHFDRCDVTGTPPHAEARKSLRLALTLCTAAALGADPQAAVYPAVAVEFLHNFALIHDDVLDHDRIHLGSVTGCAAWGATKATLLGDALHALAVQVLAGGLAQERAMAAIVRLESAAVELCHRRQSDRTFDTRAIVTVDDYLDMAMHKTGTLFGCACALGALAAGAGPRDVVAMDRFGRELGVAFHCVEDYLGIWGGPMLTGNPVGTDIARRRRSLPIVVALASGGTTADELAGLYRRETELTAEELARALTLVESSGAQLATCCLADQRLHTALSALPAHAAVDDLVALARLTTNRDW